jgi:hypothetical protein
VNPFSPNARPICGSGACNGASTTPPTAPSAAASTNTASDIRRGEMPTILAASASIAVARMAMPGRVRTRNHHSATTATAVVPATHGYWSGRLAPATRSGSPSVNGRAKRGSLPAATRVAPWMTADAPMVRMISRSVDARRAGWITARLTSAPTQAVPATATAAAASRLVPAPASSA